MNFRVLLSGCLIAVFAWMVGCGGMCGERPGDDQSDGPPGVAKLYFSTYHNCVLDDAGNIWCAGRNEKGELGDGTTRYREQLVEVQGLEEVVDFEVGIYDNNCAWNDAGDLWCWGNNAHGVLADNELEFSAEPVAIDGLPAVADVSVGAYHACALTEESTVYCWGRNIEGQLGLGEGAGDRVTTPMPVDGLEDVRQIGAGGVHTCVLTEDGEVYCWGDNDRGQLGVGLDTSFHRPDPVPISELLPGPAKQLEVGFRHSCVLVGDDRRLFCWGANDYGQLGTDDLQQRNEPTEVPEIAHVDDLAVSGGQVCAKIDETVYCAGEVMRPVEVARETGEGYVFRRSEVLDGVTQLWSGVRAVCGAAGVDTVACEGVEHRPFDDGAFD